MSSVIAGIEFPNLARRSVAFWSGCVFVAQLLVVAVPVVVKAAQIEARVELASQRSEAATVNLQELRAAGAGRDARLAAIEKDAELRGAQLDRIEGDVKELLRRVR